MKKDYEEENVRKNYRELTKYLINHNLTITTMESCTSGQIASLITDTEGASAVLKGAWVTYSNEVKIMEGVPAKVIENYSVYSKETARAMAEVCREKLGADIGIGVTGSMGNTDPANPESSVPGQVYFAIACGEKVGGKTRSYYVELEPQESRLMYKLAVAQEVFEALTAAGSDPVMPKC